MKITFLGTGTSQGVPIIGCIHPVCLSDNLKDKRLRSSILIEINDLCIAVDCGPDFRQQMLNAKVSKLDAILFTHHHSDHIAGLDDTRAFSLKYGDLPIYAKKDVIENLKDRYKYIFATTNRYQGAASLSVNHITNKPFKVESLMIEPIEINHGDLKIFGFKFNKFAYLTDVKTIEQKEIDKLIDIDILVLSCLRIKEHPTHLNLKEALELVQKIKPKKTYFTHISHMLGFHDEVSSQLPENVFLAYDGLRIDA